MEVLYEQTTYLREEIYSFFFFFSTLFKPRSLTGSRLDGEGHVVSLTLLKGAITEPSGNEEGKLEEGIIGYLTFTLKNHIFIFYFYFLVISKM